MKDQAPRSGSIVSQLALLPLETIETRQGRQPPCQDAGPTRQSPRTAVGAPLPLGSGRRRAARPPAAQRPLPDRAGPPARSASVGCTSSRTSRSKAGAAPAGAAGTRAAAPGRPSRSAYEAPWMMAPAWASTSRRIVERGPSCGAGTARSRRAAAGRRRRTAPGADRRRRSRSSAIARQEPGASDLDGPLPRDGRARVDLELVPLSQVPEHLAAAAHHGDRDRDRQLGVRLRLSWLHLKL